MNLKFCPLYESCLQLSAESENVYNNEYAKYRFKNVFASENVFRCRKILSRTQIAEQISQSEGIVN